MFPRVSTQIRLRSTAYSNRNIRGSLHKTEVYLSRVQIYTLAMQDKYGGSVVSSGAQVPIFLLLPPSLWLLPQGHLMVQDSCWSPSKDGRKRKSRGGRGAERGPSQMNQSFEAAFQEIPNNVSTCISFARTYLHGHMWL